MANLTGSPLDLYVQNQIKRRQQVIGNNPIIKNDVGYNHQLNHNKTAWVRLASSVNLTKKDAVEEFTFNTGLDLAQRFVLIGGVTSIPLGDTSFLLGANDQTLEVFNNANLVNKGGISPNLNIDSNLSATQYSYGLGGSEYGFSPIPGLGSVSINHLNRGAIRKFNIKLSAQNKNQLAIIEALYLRLGYYMLLEWGHTNYIDNEGTYVAKPDFFTPAYNSFFSSGQKDLDIEEAIKERRHESGGNYDGALFKVDNYTWSVGNDGSYDITLSGVSKGGLIESLVIGSPREFTKEENKPLFTDYLILDPDKSKKKEILRKLGISSPSDSDLVKVYKETIGTRLSKGDFDKLKEVEAIQIADPNAITTPDTLDISSTFDSTDDDATITILDQNKSVVNNELFKIFRELKQKDWKKVNDKLRYKKVVLRPELLKGDGIEDLGEALSIKFDNASDKDNAAEYNYITLGALLSIIKEKVLTSNNNLTVPISDGYQDNYMFTHWFQHSTDPRICLIPFNTIPGSDVNTQEFNKIISSTFRIAKNESLESFSPYKGYLMAIHVNIEFISKTLKESAEERGGINLYIFLEKLMYGIQSALGNINRFTVTYDDENGINIKDDTIIPGVNDTDPDPLPTSLRLYGTLPNVEGSFVKNVSAQSKITGKMATQIAIGSTASGNSINSSTSLLARWNSGLIDRLQSSETNTKNTTEAEPNELLEEVNKQYEAQLKFLKESYENFKYLGSPSYASAQTTLKNLLDYDLAVKTINGNIAGKGFIPIDLTLEMDGLSGILLYQKIHTTEEILPSSYNNKVDFIVQSLNHTISNNEWTTTVSTLSVPKRTDLTKNTKGDDEFSLLNPPDLETGEQEEQPTNRGNKTRTNPQEGWITPEVAAALNN